MFFEMILGWFGKNAGISTPADTPGLRYRLEYRRPQFRIEAKRTQFKVD